MNTKNQFISVISVVLLACLPVFSGMAQGTRLESPQTIAWYPLRVINSGESTVSVLSFEGSVLRLDFEMLPVFKKSFPFSPESDSIGDVFLEDQVYEQVNESGLLQVKGLDKISLKIPMFHELSVRRKLPCMEVSLLPLRRNPATGSIERLVSFKLVIQIIKHRITPSVKSVNTYVSNSVLASGAWFKYAVGSNGIYRRS